MTAGLTAIGVSSDIAGAAVLVYRFDQLLPPLPEPALHPGERGGTHSLPMPAVAPSSHG
jgi:hypothetical protein